MDQEVGIRIFGLTLLGAGPNERDHDDLARLGVSPSNRTSPCRCAADAAMPTARNTRASCPGASLCAADRSAAKGEMWTATQLGRMMPADTHRRSCPDDTYGTMIGLKP